jgi:hypothetical protein
LSSPPPYSPSSPPSFSFCSKPWIPNR